MRILMTMPGHTSKTLFSLGPDNSREPFVLLRQRLKESGHTLFAPDESLEADVLLAWDVPPPDVYAHFVDKRAVLILGEPRTVLPANWERTVHQRFDTVLTWHDDWLCCPKYVKFHFPQAHTFGVSPDVPFEARKLLVSVSSNKASSEPGELYSARLEVIHYGTYYLPNQFDFFGHGWQDVPGWKGTIDTKTRVLPYYRFTLCYENTCGAAGYITEKIFDALRCGSVPVYWGASNIEQYVPPTAFIDRRAFRNTHSLIRYLQGVSEHDWHIMRHAGMEYLNSAAFKAFLPDAFVKTIQKVIT